MTGLILDILIKSIDIFLIRSKFKSALQKTLLSFIEKHDTSVKQNARIKRRYDEEMEKLRKSLDKKDKQIITFLNLFF